MKRVVTLAVIFIALGFGVAWLAGSVGAANRVALRWVVLLGLPILVGLLGVALVPGPRLASLSFDRRLAILAGALVALDLLPIGAGFLLHEVTFTYGDQTLAAARILAVMIGLPALVVVTIVGWERGLRERLCGGATAVGASGRGAILSIGAGVALSVVAFAPGFEPMDRSFAAAACGTALLREATAVRLWRAGGRALSGLYRGVLAGIEGLVIADWASFWFPSANFVSSDPLFAWLRLSGPVLGLGCAWYFTRRFGAPEGG